MEYVDLRRRREEHARRKPEASRRSAARNPLFLFGAGIVLGCIISLIFYGMHYVGDFLASLPVVLAVALLCYFLRLPGKRPGETGPKFGSEKQLEAEEILTRFANRGHLVVHSRDAALLYALPGRRPAPEPGAA